MLENILKRRASHKDVTGIGFDQHYTDSTLKLLAPRSYRKSDRVVTTQRMVPKHEILSSLLLFGKAYLSHPNWLSGDPHGLTRADFPEMEKLESEDLIGWMPDDVYESAYGSVILLLEKLMKRADSENHSSLPASRLTGDYDRYQFKMEMIESELSNELIGALEEVFYLSPMVRANLGHFKVRLADPLSPLLYPISYGIHHLAPYSGFQSEWGFSSMDNNSFLRRLMNFDAVFYDERAFVLAALLDGLVSSLAAEQFAAKTQLPIKTSDSPRSPKIGKTSFGLEAYQLVKIQFRDLRYPVIETIEDVLRLREDPHLRGYRAVVAEYSERLRQELESDRPRVITDFRTDMQSALKSLAAVKRWSKVVDLSFYISLPLVVIGFLSGLPLSDILTIPLTSYAKFVAYQKRKELDWILFGRPGAD